jgi:nitrite reductase/ring-hydroxylating ferredoxin subunit
MSVELDRSKVICALDELPDPGAREFSMGEGDWPLRGFVVRYRGQVFAYRNSCPHAGHPLNWKPNGFFALGNELLMCSSHGALFTPDTGKCIAGPCVGRALRALEIEVNSGYVVLREQPDVPQSH